MQTYAIDPLTDSRWAELIVNDARASIFHTPGWLRSLRATYQYEAAALTTAPPGAPLKDGLVFCSVSSWLTGRRLVSLPFSDHCRMLGDNESQNALVEALRNRCELNGHKYVELRLPIDRADGWDPHNRFDISDCYCLHTLDLEPTLEMLFTHFDKESIQRRIRRAHKEHLVCETGTSEDLLLAFYRLLRLTRRRHGLPPQPVAWFRNLILNLRDHLTIRVALFRGRPIASILTLEFNNVLFFKYACSDSAFHYLGPIQFLLWDAIQQAKQRGVNLLDLGRSDAAGEGLIAFKEHWNARASGLRYYRYPKADLRRTKQPAVRLAREVLSLLPNVVQPAIGKLLYRHVG